MSPQVGKVLVVVGVLLAAVGLVLMVAPRIPLVSKLDFSFHGERWHVFFPLGTCLLLSGLLTLVLWLLRRF